MPVAVADWYDDRQVHNDDYWHSRAEFEIRAVAKSAQRFKFGSASDRVHLRLTIFVLVVLAVPVPSGSTLTREGKGRYP